MKALHICHFTALDDLKSKDRKDYAKVKAAVLAAGRFSAFDASDMVMARQLTRLCKDPDLVIDKDSVSYPWVLVRLAKAPNPPSPANEVSGPSKPQEPQP